MPGRTDTTILDKLRNAQIIMNFLLSITLVACIWLRLGNCHV